MADEMVDAVVVEADRVEHTGRGFDGARRDVAGARLPRDRLGDDTAEFGEVNDAGHFTGITEGAGGNEDWVAQLETAERNREIRHHFTDSWLVCHPLEGV